MTDDQQDVGSACERQEVKQVVGADYRKVVGKGDFKNLIWGKKLVFRQAPKKW